jgi:hypothetical protein
MNKLSKSLGLLLLWLIIPFTLMAQAERIISFNSLIRVHTDAGITVSEEIKVYAGGNEIQRGIYRSLPIRYSDNLNNNYNARYEILAVLRDGKEEPYHVEYEGDFMNIYIGEESVFLTPGEYTYTISYFSPRQVRFFENYDELYWNVTGNQWAFMIEQASVTVKMPYPTTVIQQSAYTGLFGDQGQDFVMRTEPNGDIVCSATRMLGPMEGLSFAFSFPKGIIQKPTATQNFWYYVYDNIWTVFGTIIILLVALYFLYAWFKVGRDPAKGAIPVLYFPPEELSPGAMRYIHKMGFDNKAFTAAVIQMAVKKYLVIHNEGGEYTLKKVADNTDALTMEEKTLAGSLFSGSNSIVLKNTNHTTLAPPSVISNVP